MGRHTEEGRAQLMFRALRQPNGLEGCDSLTCHYLLFPIFSRCQILESICWEEKMQGWVGF